MIIITTVRFLREKQRVGMNKRENHWNFACRNSSGSPSYSWGGCPQPRSAASRHSGEETEEAQFREVVVMEEKASIRKGEYKWKRFYLLQNQ